MATLFGRLDAFEENKETWEQYTERLGYDAMVLVMSPEMTK